MKRTAGVLQVVMFYALEILFILFSISHGWDALEANTSHQYVLAAFFSASILWLLYELYRLISDTEGLYPLLIHLVGLGLCVGYLMRMEEGSAKPKVTQPQDIDTVTVSGDTLVAVQKGDTIYYRIGDRVLIDKKGIDKR
ncbi:hypothetical protein CLV24_10752 [Pontibacter ummariensis]|uniref:Uncharacterized protein n=1 Tax=Pontibacter ummariensis TaxID=1610492 RepID=A0A239F0B3_9BACT|nr:hypothetical protein [Pontibacter ummariensis]PRY12681.1 hypothetical protein CLV24_10752 [Pontibacter ummariensis]SNS49723.1 hypothetical protein SAMN06296052_107136 [Pontibacter ummariensis]